MTDDSVHELGFNMRNGAELLGRRFVGVERRDVEGTVVFPDPQSMRTFVAATILRFSLATRVPRFDEPFRARTLHSVFVAERSA